MHIACCVCNNLITSLSKYEIKLDWIVQKRAVVNETVLTSLPYQLPYQSQRLFGVARPPADKMPSEARLAPHDGKVDRKQAWTKPHVQNFHAVIIHFPNICIVHVRFQVNNFQMTMTVWKYFTTGNFPNFWYYANCTLMPHIHAYYYYNELQKYNTSCVGVFQWWA